MGSDFPENKGDGEKTTRQVYDTAIRAKRKAESDSAQGVFEFFSSHRDFLKVLTCKIVFLFFKFSH